MSPKIPSVVSTLLNEYVTAINHGLPSCIEGLYLHGSIALDAYVENESDIDFVTIVNRRLTEADVQQLSEIHRELSDKYTHPQMDGMYLQWHALGKDESQIDPYPYYNDNAMHAAGYFNQNPVTWWVLKHHGIAILGPDPKKLEIAADDHLLLEYVHHNMNTYWANRLKGFEDNWDKLPLLPEEVMDWEIQWSVLGMLRQYYTLKERDIICKRGAGEYALVNMPHEWHQVIKEALRIRNKLDECYYTSQEQRLRETMAFLHYILSYCNTNYPGA